MFREWFCWLFFLALDFFLCFEILVFWLNTDGFICLPLLLSLYLFVSLSLCVPFPLFTLLLLKLSIYLFLVTLDLHCSLCHELLSSISDGEDVSGLLATLVALAKGRLWDRGISLPNPGPEVLSTLLVLCLDGQLPGHLFCIQTQNPAGCSFCSTHHFVFLFYFWITETLFWLSSLSLLLFFSFHVLPCW